MWLKQQAARRCWGQSWRKHLGLDGLGTTFRGYLIQILMKIALIEVKKSVAMKRWKYVERYINGFNQLWNFTRSCLSRCSYKCFSSLCFSMYWTNLRIFTGRIFKAGVLSVFLASVDQTGTVTFRKCNSSGLNKDQGGAATLWDLFLVPRSHKPQLGFVSAWLFWRWPGMHI